MKRPQALDALPLPLQHAAIGAVVLGAVGVVVGFVVGLVVHPATSWAAAFEVGIPSALLGLLLGLASGAVWTGVSGRRHPAGR